MVINDKFYNGYEGDAKYTICLYINNDLIEQFGIWGGYFSDIVCNISFGENGWTGLAYYYHLCIGYEENEWRIEDVHHVCEQLMELDAEKLECQEEKEVLFNIIRILKFAIDNNGVVSILYD